MRFKVFRLVLILAAVIAFPFSSPAPLVYTPGEGWSYEPVGGEGKWTKTRAKDQLEVAQAAFDQKDFRLALKASRRVVRVWPSSDYVPQAQYLAGRCLEESGNEEKAFLEYQKILEKNPKVNNYDEILSREYAIAIKFLEGKWFKLWGYIPFFPSMEKTADMFAKIVKNGPYSQVAPQAQLKIGEAREKKSEYPQAVKAYETAADRYVDRETIAAEAWYRAGMAYNKQAQTADYDQTTAGQAIATLRVFMDMYPSDPRAAESEKVITALRLEQARGNFQTAKFYEKRKKRGGALVYYNEVILRDPNSPYATEARQRIDTIKQQPQPQPLPPAAPVPAK
jgi:outer membrane protein assembly factor BamD (BamD/ComL family)